MIHSKIDFLIDNENFEEAHTLLLELIDEKPDDFNVALKLARVCLALSKLDEAIDYADIAISLEPKAVFAHLFKGISYSQKGDVFKAQESYLKILKIQPQNLFALKNLGSSSANLHQYDKALDYYNEALKIKPDFLEAHLEKSFILLRNGDFKNGWIDYQWRLKHPDFKNRNYSQPFWNNENLKNKTIFIYAEQGLGDVIQFVRYLPLIKQMGAKIIFECHKPIFDLIKNIPEIDEIILSGEIPQHFDFHCPLLNLPVFLSPTINDIPKPISFKTDEILFKNWFDKLSPFKNKKIGLAWMGSQHNQSNSRRSIPFDDIKILKKISNVHFFTLHHKDELHELNSNDKKWLNPLLSENTNNLSEMASAISCLDAVITVDTALAHLAASLNIKTCILLGKNPDWRWLLNRSDSIWYESVTLLRQNPDENWNKVLGEVTEIIKKN